MLMDLCLEESGLALLFCHVDLVLNRLSQEPLICYVDKVGYFLTQKQIFLLCTVTHFCKLIKKDQNENDHIDVAQTKRDIYDGSDELKLPSSLLRYYVCSCCPEKTTDAKVDRVHYYNPPVCAYKLCVFDRPLDLYRR